MGPFRRLPAAAAAAAALAASASAAACGHSPTYAIACTDCPVPAHGTQVCDPADDTCGPCLCLPLEPVPPDPAWATTYYVDPDAAAGGDGSAAAPWTAPDWPAIDAALGAGDVAVYFSARAAAADEPQPYAEELQILRTDTGPARLLLDGRARWSDDGTPAVWSDNTGTARARVPGATTTEELVKRSRVTLRGFELVDSSAQGVFWEAGDDVVLEDLVVHRNGRSPAIALQYASRSGLPSSNLVIRNNHLYDIKGECIYIGGVETEPVPSHTGVTIENNLVHHCGAHNRYGDDWDGINVKDGITDVVVRRNVIFESHWGLQMDSGALIEGNLIYDTYDDGIMLGDGWGANYSTTRVVDTVILRGAEDGLYVGADRTLTDGLAIEHLTVAGMKGAGIAFAGRTGVTASVEALLDGDAAAGLDGWGSVTLAVGACGLFDVEALDAGAAAGAAAACATVAPDFVDLADPAGADHVFFTDDDGWRPRDPAVLAGATDGSELGARVVAP